MQKNKFVFVVCGDKKHIQTLNYSLSHLKHFSDNEIAVVTDLSRNDTAIRHNKVINIKTPNGLSHHQAGIYLKIGLHKFLDMKHRYCYLDSDVIAVDKEVDKIFNYKSGPINFATDHCPLPCFSPNALNCGCIEKRKANIELLIQLENEYLKLSEKHKRDLKFFNDKYIPKDPLGLDKYRQLKKIIAAYSEDYSWFLKMPPFFQFALARIKPNPFNFEHFIAAKGDFIWNDKQKRAYDSANNLLYDAKAEPPQHPSYYHHIKGNSKFIWSEKNKFWLDEMGKDLYAPAACSHLQEALADKFNVKITQNNWRHWNGGVFLFDEESIEFLDTWLNCTMEIFKDPNWKIRDQGTLIATSWKMGLQNLPRLPVEFNFLADANNSGLRFNNGVGFTLDGYKNAVKPHFIHVYHHFGNKGWDVWDYVESVLPGEAQGLVRS